MAWGPFCPAGLLESNCSVLCPVNAQGCPRGDPLPRVPLCPLLRSPQWASQASVLCSPGKHPEATQGSAGPKGK